MLQLLNLFRLSVHRKYLKLTTMYNIVSGHMYLPSSIFVQLITQAHLTCTFNFTKPFAHTNDMYHSFVPSVILSWNYFVLYLALKGLCCIILRNMYHISFAIYTHVKWKEKKLEQKTNKKQCNVGIVI